MSSSKRSEYVRSVSALGNTDRKKNTGTRPERLRPSKRKLIQLYSAFLYNAHLKGFIDGEIYTGKAKAVCVPGLNCYSCPGAVGSCPLGAIQNALAYSGHRAGWYVLGMIMLFGLTLGRTICGWLCPMGLIQELLYRIPTPKIRKSRVTGVLSWLKYVVLAVFAVVIPLWYGIRHDLPVPAFCKYICPAGTFEGTVGLLANSGNAGYFSMLKILFARKFVIMLVIGLACIFCYRSFCRFLCPLGAIYGLFNRLALVSMKVDEERCNSCGACVRTCRMDVRRVGDHECINCAGCMSSCSRNALSLRAGTHTIIAPACGCRDGQPAVTDTGVTDTGVTDTGAGKQPGYGRISRGAALGVLCFALLWFNFSDPSVRKAGDSPAGTAAAGTAAGEKITGAAAGEKTAGTAAGDRMADFTAELTDGTSFRLSDQRGKVVIINMWATWCEPCVKELPVLQDFLQAHGEDAAVLIIHASDPLEDVPAYLDKIGISLPCAIDSMDEDLYGLSGASPSVLPHTVILNREGEIVYNETGSITKEFLDELFEKVR